LVAYAPKEYSNPPETPDEQWALPLSPERRFAGIASDVWNCGV
jgi:hypothetical protein